MAVLMMTAVLPTAFAASDDVIATGTGGEGITWTLTEGGVLTVRGNGPIVDDVEVVYDEDGYASTEMRDCIGWQLDRVWENLTEGMDAGEAERVRFEFVKELVIEEGITAIPGDEFRDICPRSITLPATLTDMDYSAVNAAFAQTLTIRNKALIVTGKIVIAAHRQSAEAYGSVEEAIEAKIAYETLIAEIERKTSAVYDLGAAYELQCGIDNGLTQAELLENCNTFYGTDITTLDDLIAYCIEQINTNFDTQYRSVGDIFTIVSDEDGSWVQWDDALDTRIMEAYESADIEDSLCREYLGEYPYEDYVVYPWLTVYAPSGGDAEEAAKISGVHFVSTDVPDNSFLGKLRQFFAPIKAFVLRLYNWIKFYLSVLKK